LIAAGLDPGPVVRGDFTARGGANATRELLADDDRPTAIFYSNDLMAIAGMSVLTAAGIKVPSDIAVAGFDDISLASYVEPQLSSIHCDYRTLGDTAATRLLAVIAGQDDAPRITLPSTVRLRASTAK
jgi:DNA-binding LacI/PurR family transcriptional regulator